MWSAIRIRLTAQIDDEEEIRELAYKLWKEKNRSDDDGEKFWFEAQRQIHNEICSLAYRLWQTGFSDNAETNWLEAKRRLEKTTNVLRVTCLRCCCVIGGQKSYSVVLVPETEEFVLHLKPFTEWTFNGRRHTQKFNALPQRVRDSLVNGVLASYSHFFRDFDCFKGTCV